jgi:hypothetical protein
MSHLWRDLQESESTCRTILCKNGLPRLFTLSVHFLPAVVLDNHLDRYIGKHKRPVLYKSC